MENYRKAIREEINERWNNELKNKINEIIEPKIKKAHEDFDKSLNFFIKTINEKQEHDKIPEKNKLPINLVPIKNNNKLINPILICLCNIDIFMNLGFIKDKKRIIQNLNKIIENNLFTSFSELMFKLWTEKGGKCDPKDVDLHLQLLMKEQYKEYDPGVIINFILKKLNEEINMNQDILTDKKVKDIIENNFSISIIMTYTCRTFETDNKVKEKENVLNLYINEPDIITNIGGINKSTFEDFSYMIIKEFNAKKHCEHCKRSHELRVGEIIDELSNYVIINLNREKDPIRKMNFIYPKQFKLKDISKETKKENSSYELISVIMDNKIQLDYEEEILLEPELTKIKTYSKNFNDNKWYLYTEEEITLVKNEDEIINSKNALILVYKKINV